MLPWHQRAPLGTIRANTSQQQVNRSRSRTLDEMLMPTKPGPAWIPIQGSFDRRRGLTCLPAECHSGESIPYQRVDVLAAEICVFQIATHRATPPRTAEIAIIGISLSRAWVKIAPVMRKPKPVAAKGTRIRPVSKIRGRARARAANASSTPIAFTYHKDTSLTQAILVSSLVLSCIIFMAPARTKTAAKMYVRMFMFCLFFCAACW